jgi:hypothetical protein
MDAFLLTQALEQPVEKYTDKMYRGDKVIIVEKKGFSFMKMMQLILSLAISAYAAYLSWNCSVGEPGLIRVISALFAWFFGVLYILFYAFFKSKSCAMM